MKFKLFDKVTTQNMDGKYNNVLGKVIKVHTDMADEPVYTVEYDVPIGSITRGMFKESDLKATMGPISCCLSIGERLEVENENLYRKADI